MEISWNVIVKRAEANVDALQRITSTIRRWAGKNPGESPTSGESGEKCGKGMASEL